MSVRTRLLGMIVRCPPSAPHWCLSVSPRRRRPGPRPTRPAVCLEPARAAPPPRAAGRWTTSRCRPATSEPMAREARARLRAKGTTFKAAGSTSAVVPVYVHVMRDAAGNGDVTDRQINQQIAVLNKTFAGGESAAAANTGFSFALAGVDRSTTTRGTRTSRRRRTARPTRQGGANALNIWLVDFKYLGIATFPWDYEKNADIDGIRVHYASLPGRLDRQLRPRRDRDARGGPLVRALPHVPGRLHGPQRRGRGHPGPGQPHLRLPRGPGLLPGARARPDPQLHGLQLRHLLRPVHRGSEHACPQMWAAYRA